MSRLKVSQSIQSSSAKQTLKGQGFLEFALVLPLLMLLILGLIEFGRLMFFFSAITTATRESARFGSAAGDLSSTINRYEDCAGIRAAGRRIGSLAGIEDADIVINYDQGPGTPTYATCTTSLIFTNPNITEVSLGDRINVTINGQFNPLIPLINIPAIPISSTAKRTILKDVEIK